MKHLFSRITPEMMVERQLYEARVSLIQARVESEYWEAIQTMLESRVARLEGEIAEAASRDEGVFLLGGQQ